MRRRLSQSKDQYLSTLSPTFIDFSALQEHMHFLSPLLLSPEFGVPFQRVLKQLKLLFFYAAIIQVFYVELRVLHLSLFSICVLLIQKDCIPFASLLYIVSLLRGYLQLLSVQHFFSSDNL